MPRYNCIIELEVEAQDEDEANVLFWQEFKEMNLQPYIKKMRK